MALELVSENSIKPGDLVHLSKNDIVLQGRVYGIGPDLRVELDLFSPELAWLLQRGFLLALVAGQ